LALREKILWRTPYLKMGQLFYFTVPLWLYVIYCFSFSYSVFSQEAIKIVWYNYWPLLILNYLSLIFFYYLWMPILYFLIPIVIVVFYHSSAFLLSANNRVFLVFDLIFIVIALEMRNCLVTNASTGKEVFLAKFKKN
jgi:hypothetical protein